MPDEDKNTEDQGGNESGDQGNDQASQQQIAPEVISRAQRYGWVPEEDFKGDKSKWVPADVFVKRADEVLPIARAMNRKLEKDLDLTKKELSEMKNTVKTVIQAHKKFAAGSYEAEIARIEREQIEAVASADSDKWAKLEQDKKKLAKPEEIPFNDAPAGATTTENPIVTKWKEDNPWYNDDLEMGIEADIISDRLAARKLNLSPEEFLQKVKEMVMKKFPDKFGNQKRNSPPVVDRTNYGGGDGGGDNGGGKHTYADLPADAKAVCDETIKAIKAAGGKMTRDDYVRDYFA